jgi:hypothetical protein
VISTTTQASQNIRMNFNHPTKYLAWNFTPGTYNAYGRYTATLLLSVMVGRPSGFRGHW